MTILVIGCVTLLFGGLIMTIAAGKAYSAQRAEYFTPPTVTREQQEQAYRQTHGESEPESEPEPEPEPWFTFEITTEHTHYREGYDGKQVPGKDTLSTEQFCEAVEEIVARLDAALSVPANKTKLRRQQASNSAFASVERHNKCHYVAVCKIIEDFYPRIHRVQGINATLVAHQQEQARRIGEAVAREVELNMPAPLDDYEWQEYMAQEYGACSEALYVAQGAMGLTREEVEAAYRNGEGHCFGEGYG